MTSYDAFMPYVLPDVDGCPEVVAVQAVRESVIQFCRESLIYQVVLDPITAIIKKSHYDLEAPRGTRVEKVMAAWFEGSLLEPIAPDSIASPAVYNARADRSVGRPRFYTQQASGELSIMPIPDQTVPQSITLRAALVPLRSSSTCEDFLFEDWCEPIAAGAIARLQMTPGKPYTNPAFASTNQTKFQLGLNTARQQTVRGRVRSSLSVQMRRP